MGDQHGMWIGGQEHPGTSWLADIDPSTGQEFATVARCTADDVDTAVRAARAAQPGWAARTPRERGQALIAFAAAIERNLETLTALEVRDTGKPVREADDDVRTAAGYFAFYGEAVDKVYGDRIDVPGGVALTQHVPHGVTGHIIPWNFPIALFGRTVAPALAMGNASVIKPAPETPLTALALARLAAEAGIPDGVINVVPGLGPEAGAAVTGHSGVDHVSFTGSREVGAEVMRAAAGHTAPVMLELGGKSPSVVLADADLKALVPVVKAAALTNAGQVCSALTRIVVERPLHDELINALVAEFETVRIGPGRDDLDLGPLISDRQLRRVEGYIQAGRDEGAVIATGGQRPPGLGDGFFYSPTLLTGVGPEARVAREEIFGPALTVLAFDQLADATRVANGTDYGLVGAVWTRDLDRALTLANSITAGQVYVNNWGLGTGIDLPFGGTKASGFGREKGLEALTEYSQVKTTIIAFGDA